MLPGVRTSVSSVNMLSIITLTVGSYRNKSRLLFSSADMFKKPLWQTVWTQISCSYRSRLIWVHTVCFYALLVSNVMQLFAADDFSRRHFQMHFFLGTLRVNLGLYESCNMVHEKMLFFFSFLQSSNHGSDLFLFLYENVCCGVH